MAADTPGTLFADMNFAIALSTWACFSGESLASWAETIEVIVRTLSATAKTAECKTSLRRFFSSQRQLRFIVRYLKLLAMSCVRRNSGHATERRDRSNPCWGILVQSGDSKPYAPVASVLTFQIAHEIHLESFAVICVAGLLRGADCPFARWRMGHRRFENR